MSGPIYTIKGAAEAWGVSTDYIRRQIASGRLNARRAGRVVRIKHADLERLFRPTSPRATAESCCCGRRAR